MCIQLSPPALWTFVSYFSIAVHWVRGTENGQVEEKRIRERHVISTSPFVRGDLGADLVCSSLSVNKKKHNELSKHYYTALEIIGVILLVLILMISMWLRRWAHHAALDCQPPDSEITPTDLSGELILNCMEVQPWETNGVVVEPWMVGSLLCRCFILSVLRRDRVWAIE